MRKTKPTVKPEHHRERWTKSQDRQLERDAKAGMDTPDIAIDLGRTVNAIYSRADELNISLDPPDKKNS